MEDLYLEEQRIKIEEFTKILANLYVNDSDLHRQLQSEFNTLSALPENIKDIININKEYLCTQSFYRDYTNQCRITQSLLNKKIFEIHKQTYNNSYNSDFNYLYNYDENLNGTEMCIYDIKSQTKIPTCELKFYKPNSRLTDKIRNYVKISNSYLLIMGPNKYESKGFLMDLKTKAISEIFNFKNKAIAINCFNQFIYYDNYIYVFGDSGRSGLMKYDINLNKWRKLPFPRLDGRIFSVLFHDYVIISLYSDSRLYLYDLLIEAHSEITFYNGGDNCRFLFTDQMRVYLWIQNSSIYESDVNNPFKWNKIGNNNFGIRYSPYDITFSNFEGNLYASFIVKPQMLCYKFNKERKEMELIYQSQTNIDFLNRSSYL